MPTRRTERWYNERLSADPRDTVNVSFRRPLHMPLPPARPARLGKATACTYSLSGARSRLLLFVSFVFMALSCGRGDSDRPVWIDAFPYGRTVQSISTTEKIVALTFDDGPNEPYTGQILDVLRERNIKATFFVVGVNATRHPETLLRIMDEGHAIGNHTWSHPLLSTLTSTWIAAEIEQGAEVIESLSGRRPRLFRPPGGDRGDPGHLQRVCRRLECLTVMWSVNADDDDDYAIPEVDPIVERVLRQVEPGAIVLLHDGDGLKTQPYKGSTVQALPRILDGLISQGYRLVTVPELLASCDPNGC